MLGMLDHAVTRWCNTLTSPTAITGTNTFSHCCLHDRQERIEMAYSRLARLLGFWHERFQLIRIEASRRGTNPIRRRLTNGRSNGVIARWYFTQDEALARLRAYDLTKSETAKAIVPRAGGDFRSYGEHARRVWRGTTNSAAPAPTP